jgi:hypothetical protein
MLKPGYFDNHEVVTTLELLVFLFWMPWNSFTRKMISFTMAQEILNRKNLTMSHQPFNSGYE